MLGGAALNWAQSPASQIRADEETVSRSQKKEEPTGAVLSDFIFPNVLTAVVALKQLHSPVLMRVK